jgi:hypothetical protein
MELASRHRADAFQKQSPSGIRTPKQKMALIQHRLKRRKEVLA